MLVSVADVVCANTATAASGVLALEITNDFLMKMKREGKNVLEEIKKRISHFTQYMTSTRLQSSLEKILGKLSTKVLKCKGGAMRNKIRAGKTRLILQSGDIVNVATVENRLQETAVNH